MYCAIQFTCSSQWLTTMCMLVLFLLKSNSSSEIGNGSPSFAYTALLFALLFALLTAKFYWYTWTIITKATVGFNRMYIFSSSAKSQKSQRLTLEAKIRLYQSCPFWYFYLDEKHCKGPKLWTWMLMLTGYAAMTIFFCWYYCLDLPMCEDFS